MGVAHIAAAMPKPLRILHIGKFYPPYKGGMETHLQTLCRGLQKLTEVRVIVANDRPETFTEELEGIAVTRVSRLLQAGSAPVCPRMCQLIRESDADIIHIHLPNPTALIEYWRSGHKARLVVTYHSDILRQRLLASLFNPLLNQSLHRAAAIISASPNYIHHSPVLRNWRDRCHVIPFGIDPHRFDSVAESDIQAIRSRFGSKLVLAVGRLVYYKGFQYLISAIKSVNAHLMIIGDGPLKSKLQHQVTNLGLARTVTILDDVKNVAPYYKAASVFALPSCARTEAFGIVQLEAMAACKPVVNTDLDSGVPFVSQHGITGLTVPPKNPVALATAINTILENPALAVQYGNAARRRVLAEFTVASMVQRTMKLYEDVFSLSGAAEPTDMLSEPEFTNAL